MRGLAKSVIKENPQNIYEFAAEYFENLLKERDGSVDQSYKKFATYKVYKKNKSARLKRAKENSSNDVNNDVPSDNAAVNYKVLGKRDESVEELIVQKQAVQSLARGQISLSSESEINATIEKKPSLDVDAPPTQDDDDDVKNMVLDDDMEQAALKIQASFRGHKVRKEVKDKKQNDDDDDKITEVTEQVEEEDEQKQPENVSVVNEDENADVDDEIANMVLDDDMEQAALKIQSSFRGHKVRREIKETFAPEVDDEVAPDDDLALQESEASEPVNESEIVAGVEQEKENSEPEVELLNSEEAASEVREKLSTEQSVDGAEVETACEDDKEIPSEVVEEEIVHESDTSTALEQEEGAEVVTETDAEHAEDMAEVEQPSESPETAVEASAADVTGEEEEEEKLNESSVEVVDETVKISQQESCVETTDAVVEEDVAEIVDGEVCVDILDEEENTTEPTNAITDEGVEVLAEKINVEETAETLEEEINAEDVEETVEILKDEINAEDVEILEAEPSAETLATAADEAAETLESLAEAPSPIEEINVAEENLLKADDVDENPPSSETEKPAEGEISFERLPTIENENFVEVAEMEAEGETLTPDAMPNEDDEVESVQNEPIDVEGENLMPEEVREDLTNEQSVADVEPTVEEVLEGSIESEVVIELTDNVQSEPQETVEPTESNELVDLPNESESENVPEPDDADNGIPVVEPLCVKKSIENLECDQENIESEIDEAARKEGSLSEIEADRAETGDSQTGNLEKLPSGDIEYSALTESAESIDEEAENNKSRNITTDEKSIDDDTNGSKQLSLDEKSNVTQDDGNEREADEIDGFIRPSSVDDIEMNGTHQVEPPLNVVAVESILQSEISPIELMDEVVNECAGAVANELFNNVDNASALESDLIKSINEGKEEEEVELKLSSENPLQDIEAPKSIDLTQETVQVSQDEIEPIRDEVLQPEKEDSEIPEEESQAPMDENIPTVSMEKTETLVGDDGDENLPRDDTEDEKSPAPPQVEDDVSDMILDDEMEEAALKIQAAFRGHQVRKEQTIVVENELDENVEEQKVETNVVIDQCSEDNQETQEQEEAEQQDTSADVEEIQDSEAVDQEETQEGKQLAISSRLSRKRKVA